MMGRLPCGHEESALYKDEVGGVSCRLCDEGEASEPSDCAVTDGIDAVSFVTKDSSQRESFPSGMVRDTREGKGRYDLITPYGLRRLAQVYERGAAKYSDRNWEQGAPFGRFLDSALRHIEQYIMRCGDEDHLAQAAWNLFAIMHFEDTGGTGLDDRP